MMIVPEFTVLIPARLASTRLPEKLLQPLAGKPVIYHTLDRALESQAVSVIVAADDARILSVVEAYRDQLPIAQRHQVTGYLSQQPHESGTDRLAEVVQAGRVSTELVVNLQGDEPLLPGVLVDVVVQRLAHVHAPMATLLEPISVAEEVANPNIVKAIFNHAREAIYFSRSVIPFQREAEASAIYYRHIGLYAYRQNFLRDWPSLPPSSLEAVEKLEQLRVLEAGHTIAIEVVHPPKMTGIDSADQLALAEQIIEERRLQG